MLNKAQYFPYIRAEERSPYLMLDTAIALIPPFFMACFYYGSRSLVLGALTVAAAIVARRAAQPIETTGEATALSGGTQARLLPA